jgi:putative phosphonate transport system ATP-binding protein
MSGPEWLLRVERLSKRYGPGCAYCRQGIPMPEGNHCPRCGTVYAVREVSFEVYPGEVLGIVGESGSGKSTLLNCLYYDAEPSSGSAYLSHYAEGEHDIFAVSAQARRSIRNESLGKVYQSPAQGLRMRFSSIANVAENMIGAGVRRVGAMEDRARYLLGRVSIPEARMSEPPERFSGGMQQRVQIAKALSNSPPLVLLDEVTTGLDLSVQAKVLDLIEGIRRESCVGMILVSHDLAVIRMLADRTMVMLGGEVVEAGLTDQILEDPQHRYTQELVHSLL